jgi:hypothetical protein
MAGQDARPSPPPKAIHYDWRGWRFPYMGKCEEAMTISASARENVSGSQAWAGAPFSS